MATWFQSHALAHIPDSHIDPLLPLLISDLVTLKCSLIFGNQASPPNLQKQIHFAGSENTKLIYQVTFSYAHLVQKTNSP